MPIHNLTFRKPLFEKMHHATFALRHLSHQLLLIPHLLICPMCPARLLSMFGKLVLGVELLEALGAIGAERRVGVVVDGGFEGGEEGGVGGGVGGGGGGGGGHEGLGEGLNFRNREE